MKIALVTGGQPRFTQAFPIFLSQLKGVTQVDLYFHFFENDWTMDEEEARRRIEPLLPESFNIKKLVIKPRPPWQLPPHKLSHTSDESQSIRWYYYRATSQFLSLNLAFNLIEEEYDAVVRYRLDGRLDQSIDVGSLDLSRGTLFPSNNNHGTTGREICDQFCIGKQDDMRFYFDFINHYDEYILETCSYWEVFFHHWSPEHLLGWHYRKNNKSINHGNFQVVVKREGRSLYDDHNHHNPVGQDPTIR